MVEQGEMALRARPHLCGVAMRLQDGAVWTVPAMPLGGPAGERLSELVSRFERATYDAKPLQDDAELEAMRNRMAGEIGPVDALSEVDKQLRAVRLVQLAGAIQDRVDAIQRAAAKSRLAEAHRIGLEMAFEALRLNYPSIDCERVSRLVTTGHLGPIYQVLTGTIELSDLFPKAAHENPRQA